MKYREERGLLKNLEYSIGTVIKAVEVIKSKIGRVLSLPQMFNNIRQEC